MSYDKIKGGTSHLRRHASTCQSTTQISETIAGESFVGLAQSLITLGVKYGQVSAKDVLPHPTTVSRKITDVAAKVKQETVMPEIQNCLNKWGGGITTDMWTESYKQVSYLTVTVHYITGEWKLVERVIATVRS